jgi:hypothetical protein
VEEALCARLKGDGVKNGLLSVERRGLKPGTGEEIWLHIIESEATAAVADAASRRAQMVPYLFSRSDARARRREVDISNDEIATKFIIYGSVG